ncbi:MAG: ArsA family ATPase [Vibrio sp.]
MYQQLKDHHVIFVGGKGGVGKTTSAAALACYFASCEQNVLVISTDPAHSLGDALDRKLDGHITKIAPYLSALELDLNQITQTHFEQLSQKISRLTKPEMRPRIEKQLALAKDAPGGQEAALLETMCRYLLEFEAMGFDKLIFDTAPTGHTLRLLQLPEMMSAWTDGLIAQQKKQQQHKAAAEPFWKRLDSGESAQHNPFKQEKQAAWQQALSSLEARKNLFRRARDVIHNREYTAIVLVMIPEKLPLDETRRSLEQFHKIELKCAGVLINQVIEPSLCQHPFWQRRYQLQQAILTEVKANISAPLYALSLQAEPVIGQPRLNEFMHSVQPLCSIKRQGHNSD